jgi:hypothetical protein
VDVQFLVPAEVEDDAVRALHAALVTPAPAQGEAAPADAAEVREVSAAA